jgi:tetratricopeptide (TPR) repeat protein
MKRIICAGWLGIFLVGLPALCPAQNADTEFAQANQAYTEGKYPQAIAAYEQILKQHGYAVSVLFNLGNAYARNQQIGDAILAYERALLLDPRNQEIQTNLREVREEAGLPVPASRWWQQVIRGLTPSGWAWVTSGLFAAFVATQLARWFIRGARNWSKTLRLAQAALVLGIFLGIACAALGTQQRHAAVVVAKEAVVKVSPFDKADAIETLVSGRTVNVDKVDKQFGEYVRVRYDRDKLGWINRKDVAAVEPGLF